jgi:hypothetical protein
MDVEKTMQFILEQQAKIEAQIGRHDSEMAEIRSTLQNTVSVIQDLTRVHQDEWRIVAAHGNHQKVMDEMLKAIAKTTKENSEQLKQLGEKTSRNSEHLDALIRIVDDLIRKPPQNGALE